MESNGSVLIKLVPSDSDDSEFEVEAIIDRRVFRNNTQYLVKWRGYGSESNTWEPAAHVTDCIALDTFLTSLASHSSDDEKVPDLGTICR